MASSTFEAEFEQAVQRGLDAQEKAADENVVFRDAWRERKGGVLRILRVAAGVLDKLKVGGLAKPDNGGVVLEAGRVRGLGIYRFEIHFSPDIEGKKIRCTATVPGFEPDSFDLKNLTDDAIEDQVKTFGKIVGGIEIEDDATKAAQQVLGHQ